MARAMSAKAEISVYRDDLELVYAILLGRTDALDQGRKLDDWDGQQLRQATVVVQHMLRRGREQ